MKVVWIDADALFYIVDSVTRFVAAKFLCQYGQSVQGIWKAFLHVFCAVYTGFPNRIRADYGSVFSAKEWKILTSNVGISLRISGTKAHNTLGIGKRLHQPLPLIYKKTEKIILKCRHTIFSKLQLKP